jgi:hypothetical protein
MSIIHSGIAAHDTTCNTAEMVRQFADGQAGANQASLNANAVIYYRAVVASCTLNGLDSGNFREALHRLTSNYS